MSIFKCRCPHCDTVLKLANGPGGKLVKCPSCETKFRPANTEDDRPAPPKKASVAPAPKAAAKKAGVVTKRRRDDSDDELPKAKRASGKGKPTSGSNTGLLLLLAGGAVAALFLFSVIGVVVAWAVFANSSSPQVAGKPPEISKPEVQNPIADNQRPNPDNQRPNFDNQKPNADDKPRNVVDDTVQEIPPLPPPEQRPFLVLDPGGHTASVRKCFLNPDGRLALTVSFDKTIRIWDVQSGETLQTIRLPIGLGEEGTINAAAISPDYKHLVVSGYPVGRGKFGVLVYVISMQDSHIETVLKGHTGTISSFAFSPDNRLLASSSGDKTVRIYKTADWSFQGELKGHTDQVTQVAFDKTSTRLATSSQDMTVRLWDLQNPANNKKLTGHTAHCNCVAWAPDGQSLASGGGSDFTVRIWSVAGQSLAVHELKEGAAGVQITSLTYTPDGKRLLYTGIDYLGSAGILDLATRARVRVAKPGHSNTVMHGSLSADGTLAITTGGDDNETLVWKTDNGQIVQIFKGEGRAVYGVGWSADGKSIVFGNTNRGSTVQSLTPLEHTFHLDTLELTDGLSGKPGRAVMKLDDLSVEALDFYRLKVTRNDKSVEIKSPAKEERLYSTSLLPDAKLIVGGGWGLYLVDLRTTKFVRQFMGHNGIILGIAPSPDGKHFVTGSSDETLRIWSVDRDEPILSIFVAGTEWIAWTPEGYYAASAYGERLMGWQVNNGVDQLPSYYSAVQFRLSLYQPDVIRLLLPDGNLQTAVAQASKLRKQKINAVQLGQVMPPTVTITSPTNVPGQVVNAANIEVKATAQSSGNYPVTSMRLLLDGRPYLGQKGMRPVAQPKLGPTEGAWTVSIPAGKHTLAVQAESTVSKGVSAPVEVTTPESGELPSMYMVAIGISAYPGKLRLHYAASDAELITKTFREKSAGVFKKIEIHLVTDHDATRARIVQELEWLESVMTARDVGIVFFSGHGAKDELGQFYLVPVDANPRRLEQTFVSGEVLKQHLANMPGKIVALLDACHSGTVADDFQTSRPDNLARDLVTDDYGVVVMCSSLGREYSMESNETKAGYFTLGLTEGLSGKADYNGDGFVFVNELNTYAAQRVRELSGGQQHPVTGRPPTIRSFALSRL